MQVFLGEVDNEVRLAGDTQHMNANKGVEDPPCRGVLDTLAFLVWQWRRRGP